MKIVDMGDIKILVHIVLLSATAAIAIGMVVAAIALPLVIIFKFLPL